ncbi:MAG: hypothetical protein DDT33_01694 [Firmicutes bacterium]|nr:hypothetical protein [Bacillota bacterium]
MRCDSHKIYGFGLCYECWERIYKAYECWERIYKAEDLSLEELRELEDALNKEYDNALNEE